MKKMAAARHLHLLQSNLSNSERPRKRRNYRRQLDPLESYTDCELRSRYRFGRRAINYIVELVAAEITPNTNRNHAVSAEMQVLVTLRFLASGSFLQVIGDTFLGFDKSTVRQVVHHVTQDLAAKLGDFIRFRPLELKETKLSKVCFGLVVFLVPLDALTALT